MKKHEFNQAYRVDGTFFEGTPTVKKNMEKIESEYPLGIYNWLYSNERWLQLNVDTLEGQMERWLLNGKISMCLFPVGCVVVVGFRFDDSPWTVTVIDPRRYLNENGNLMQFRNRSRYRNNKMQCNYSVTHFVKGVQYYARMRKMKFDKSFYLDFDNAMLKALKHRNDGDLVNRQTKECLSWDNKMFLRYQRRNNATIFEELD